MRTGIGDLTEVSLAIIGDGQTAGGAFIASPNFPTYRYCWYRDGTFVAQALDLFGDHDRAAAFYDWGARTVLRQRDVVQKVLLGPAHERPSVYLHTRYELDGSPADDDWPNFQLDGYGTFLWGMTEHLRLSGRGLRPGWGQAIEVLLEYLGHLWKSPNYDCWEELPDRIHLSTLCALYGGAAAVASRLNVPGAADLAQATRDFVLAQSAELGYLPKFVGSDAVDASVMWASIPFNLFELSDPVMTSTARKIEDDLVGPSGGVRRYASDSFYGGGEWILLTALLGECWLRSGETERAAGARVWIEAHAGPRGELPEQAPVDLIAPAEYDLWQTRWGPIATPLLWSHAAYLRLAHALRQHGADAS
ncbi:MAG TPA: glycoside hydrolase family 15 protein [Chloroflexota bacterium]|nr:glycoside hydrolase family 15 protein [Chloroflexota bacterium]